MAALLVAALLAASVAPSAVALRTTRVGGALEAPAAAAAAAAAPPARSFAETLKQTEPHAVFDLLGVVDQRLRDRQAAINATYHSGQSGALEKMLAFQRQTHAALLKLAVARASLSTETALASKKVAKLGDGLDMVRKDLEETRFEREATNARARMRASQAKRRNEESLKTSEKVFKEELETVETLRSQMLQLRLGKGAVVVTPESAVVKGLARSQARADELVKETSAEERAEADFQGNAYCARVRCGVPDCKDGQNIHLLSKATFVDDDCCDVYKCVAGPEEKPRCTIAPWADWGACSSTCGAGLAVRTRTVTPELCVDVPLEEARACSRKDGCEDEKAVAAAELLKGAAKDAAGKGGKGFAEAEARAKAAATPCPVSKWSKWSQCDKNCGPGLITRTRTFGAGRLPHNNATCHRPEGVSLVEKKPCVRNACPIACEMGDWTEWSLCDAACGAGQERRTRAKRVAAAHGGRECADDAVLETRPCTAVGAETCSAACQAGPWGAWSRCSSTCGAGTQERSRALVIRSDDPLPAGLPASKACGIATLESRPCERKKCSIHTSTLNWDAYQSPETRAGGAFERYAAGSVRLAEGRTAGNMTGSMQLGFAGKWELQFRFKPAENPERDPDDTVTVYINGKRIATLRNELAGESDGSDPNTFDTPYVRPERSSGEFLVYGASFTYNFVFSSSKAAADMHPVVMMGDAVCREAFAYNVALNDPDEMEIDGLEADSKRMAAATQFAIAALPKEVRDAAPATCQLPTAGLGAAKVYAECTGSVRSVNVRSEAPAQMKKFFDAGLRGLICPVSAGTKTKSAEERWGYVSVRQDVGPSPWRLCEPCRETFTSEMAFDLINDVQGKAHPGGGAGMCRAVCAAKDGCNKVFCEKACTLSPTLKPQAGGQTINKLEEPKGPNGKPVYKRYPRANMRTDGFDGAQVWSGKTAAQCGLACDVLEG
eukprot:g1952.t1